MTFSIVLQFVSAIPDRDVPVGQRLLLHTDLGSLIAAINFDLSGTTKIGKYVLNHSFMIPGVVSTAVAVITGLFLAKIMF